MTFAEAHRHARDVLEAAGVDSPEADAWWLLEAVTGRGRAQLVIERGRALRAEELATLLSSLERRVRREPLQHILGHTEFFGLELAVDPRALIPRPETEQLVELALERLRGVVEPRVLDVGTGAGAIAVAIASARPDARVMATDVSRGALELAESNAHRHDVAIRFVVADLLSSPEVEVFASRADTLVANLPYLPDSDRAVVSAEVEHDPQLALYGGVGGAELFLVLLEQAHSVLPVGAWLLAELDPRNVRDVLPLTGTWDRAEITADLTGRDRFLILRR